jgi:hypothetical protein
MQKIGEGLQKIVLIELICKFHTLSFLKSVQLHFTKRNLLPEF